MIEIPSLIVGRTSLLFLIAIASYLGVAALSVPPNVDRTLSKIAAIATFWQLGVWGTAAVSAWLALRRRTTGDVDSGTMSSFGIIGFLLRIALWTLIVLLMLDNLGVNITALVAGLGVGGLAIALAIQNILGDLFASLSITLDRPFVPGDFVVVGDYAGTVESIGIKIRDIVKHQPKVRFDRFHFSKYGDFALEFETAYYVLSADYAEHMETQQAIYFAIYEAFSRRKLEFAYPTQKLWISSNPPPQ